MLNFLKIVGRKSRFDCIASIRTSVHHLHDEIAGRVRATVTTAQPADDGAIKQLAQRLSRKFGKEVIISTETDPRIIGGLVVRVGDTVYDASIVNQLQQMRTKTVKRTSDAIRQSLDRFLDAT
jgi:F-type H+-transporting ATPase subunit delta